MKPLLLYLLQVTISSGILYGYYHFFLRNKKFHQYNRYYLLSIVVISIIIPFLQIPVYFDDTTTKPILLKTLTTISSSDFEEQAVITTVTAKESWFTFKNILSLLYIIVGVILFVRFLLALCRIVLMISIYPKEKLDNIQFIATTDPATPFSFFRWLFWNNKIELNSDSGQQIFRHELFHIRQKHTWDTIFLEVVTIIFWMNPFFHLIKKEIKAIHEFLADKFAVEENKEWDYAELLLMQALGSPNTRLTNPFFHNQIKRRIAMLTNSQKPGAQYLRKIMVLPLALIITGMFAFTYKNKMFNKSSWSEKPLTIVVDAGHGGDEPGAMSVDKKNSEARISLEIAKQLRELAGEYNITVVMTREDEQFPGGETDRKEANRKRVEIANKIKPAAFISLHVSTTPDKEYQNEYSGFEAYISKKRDDINNKMLASAILQNLSPLYKTRTEARIRNSTGIYVLDQNNYPAVIVECGFINNEKDLAFFTDKNNLEKIARNILEGIVKYKNSNTSNNLVQPDLINDTVPKAKDNNKIFEKLEIVPSFPVRETLVVAGFAKPAQTKEVTVIGHPKPVEKNEVVVVGFPKPTQPKEVIVAGYPKPVEKNEIVVVGYSANNTPIVKNETTVMGYARDSSKQIEEVKVVGYGTPKPNKVKAVTVIGYPIREAAKKAKQ